MGEFGHYWFRLNSARLFSTVHSLNCADFTTWSRFTTIVCYDKRIHPTVSDLIIQPAERSNVLLRPRSPSVFNGSSCSSVTSSLNCHFIVDESAHSQLLLDRLTGHHHSSSYRPPFTAATIRLGFSAGPRFALRQHVVLSVFGETTLHSCFGFDRPAGLGCTTAFDRLAVTPANFSPTVFSV